MNADPDRQKGALCSAAVAWAVFTMLAYYADSAGFSYPHQDTLARDCGITARQIRNAIRVLIAAGLVEVTPRLAHGRKVGNYYQLFGSPRAPMENLPSSMENHDAVSPTADLSGAHGTEIGCRSAERKQLAVRINKSESEQNKAITCNPESEDSSTDTIFQFFSSPPSSRSKPAEVNKPKAARKDEAAGGGEADGAAIPDELLDAMTPVVDALLDTGADPDQALWTAKNVWPGCHGHNGIVDATEDAYDPETVEAWADEIARRWRRRIASGKPTGFRLIVGFVDTMLERGGSRGPPRTSRTSSGRPVEPLRPSDRDGRLPFSSPAVLALTSIRSPKGVAGAVLT